MPNLGYQLIEHQSGKLKVWDEPVPGRKYVIGIDAAENRVRDRNLTRGKPSFGHDWPDFSAAVVIELEDALHVATWHGHMDPTDFAISTAALGLYYNNALLVPESNSVGVAIVETLVKMVNYTPIYRNRLYNRIDVDPLGFEYGFRTTETTRPLLISKIQQIINYGRLFTRDGMLIKELRTMEYDETGKPRGRGRNKDDLVMAFGLALVGRAETLTGGYDLDEKKTSRLSADDQLTYQKIHKQLDRIRNARRNASSALNSRLVVRPVPRGAF